jgi:uncharacterized protein YndB with AHSA1/START domain
MTEPTPIPIPGSQTVYRLHGKKEVVFERRYTAPPEEVFAAFADPHRVQEWWGSSGATLEVIEMDVRPGGNWRFVETDAKGRKSTFHGEYREVEPPRRIVSTLCYGASAASRLFAIRETYEFLPAEGGGTLLRLTSSYPMRPALKGMLGVGMDAPGAYTEGSRHQWRLDRLETVVKA